MPIINKHSTAKKKAAPLSGTALVIVLLVVSVALATVYAREGQDGPLHRVQSIAGMVTAPLQLAGAGVAYAADGAGDAVENATVSDSSYTALQQENAQLRDQLVQMEELRQENERLKELLGVVDSYGEYETLTARVIGKSPGAWFDEFTINAGEQHGVQENMIVYTADGLLGKVVYTSATYSRVISLIHDQSGVSAMVERTRDNGVVKAAQEGENPDDLQLFYISSNSDVKPGDRIITSGIGGVYPKGIPIAQVTEVSTDSSSEKVVIARSNVDFEHVEEVVVVLQVFEEVAQ